MDDLPASSALPASASPSPSPSPTEWLEARFDAQYEQYQRRMSQPAPSLWPHTPAHPEAPPQDGTQQPLATEASP